MEELLQWIEYIEDIRQKRKVRNSLKDILVIVLFAALANADNWVEIATFGKIYQDYLRKYIELRNGPPSHDTICRVMGLIAPEVLQRLYGKWQVLLNREEGKVLKKNHSPEWENNEGEPPRGRKGLPYRVGVEQGGWIRPWPKGGGRKKQRDRSNS